MKNPLHEKQWTQRGKVVYKRKPRSPKVSDVLRFAAGAAVSRVKVGKQLFRELYSIAVSGVKTIEEYHDRIGIHAQIGPSANETRIYIIEEGL